MASFFTIGEVKTRPGVYYRYENTGTPPVAGADNGKVCAIFRSNWGPVGEVKTLEGYNEIANIYGDGGESGTTVVPLNAFKGGATIVHAIRLGSGGTNASYDIMDTDETPKAVVRLTMKYPGTRAFTVTIRPTAVDATMTELLLCEGTQEIEKLEFSNADNSVAALMAAFAENGSDYFNLTKVADSEEALKTVTQAPITGGTDPTVTNAAYDAAFELAEPYRFNVMAIDTDEPAVHALLQLYLSRVYQDGKFAMAAVGEPSTVAFDTRLSHAKALNDYKIIYVGNGYTDTTGETHEGYKAAAYIAGLVAGTPSNESITHTAITGAVELTEKLTNSQYEKAIKAGMLTFSTSAADVVWVEQGINTLVTLGAKEDEGWKKIKRTKVRFELFQRINDTVEPLVGKVNNDPDGRATIIKLSNGVCNTMVAEKKLLTGAQVTLDTNNPPAGDSAWFVVQADDIDALEKLYYAFKFRFAPES